MKVQEDVNEDLLTHYMVAHVTNFGIFVRLFGIKPEYIGKKLSYEIFFNLYRQFNLPIYLDCIPELVPYYQKLGFEDNGSTYQDYHEMYLKSAINLQMIRKMRRDTGRGLMDCKKAMENCNTWEEAKNYLRKLPVLI